jgi:hypothetical protein
MTEEVIAVNDPIAERVTTVNERVRAILVKEFPDAYERSPNDATAFSAPIIRRWVDYYIDDVGVIDEERSRTLLATQRVRQILGEGREPMAFDVADIDIDEYVKSDDTEKGIMPRPRAVDPESGTVGVRIVFWMSQ